jgi:uncharacterized membrane protein
VVGALGYAAYLPFYIGFQSQLGGALPNLLFPTRFSQFFVMFGPFLVIAVFFLALVGSNVGGVLRRFLRLLPLTVLLPALAGALLTAALLVLPQGRAYVDSLLNDPAIQAAVGGRAPAQLAGLALRLRLATPWTWLALAALLAWALAIWLARLGSARDDAMREIAEPDVRRAADLFAVGLIGLALTLPLAVEFVYLRDLFGSRMNTVFKLYYQAWLLLALASAFAVSRLAERATPMRIKAPALAAAGALLLAGMIYPVAATPNKANDFRGPPTLDGLAYLRQSHPADVAAIEWLRAHAAPSATVLEASGGSYSPEGAGRVSMATGNPTLLGWDFHERQWRGDAYDDLVAGRPDALDQIYRLAAPESLPDLLDKWGISFVYVGGLEREKYQIADAELARLDRVLRRAYDRDGVIIYAR